MSVFCSKILRELYSLCFSDYIILHYKNLRTCRNKVNLHRYISGIENNKPETENLGDYLSNIVVKWLLKQKKIDFSTAKVNHKKHLYAIGSILLMGYQKATIWGSGMPYEPCFFRSFFHRDFFRKLDIRCCRGPLTRNTLLKLGHNCPEVYGDPAALMPLIYNPPKNKEFEFIIIPHYSKYFETKKEYCDGIVLNMETKNYKYVIDNICKAQKVISSSLHGLILAEAYGVPAIFYQDRPNRFNYKYEDWYLSTGRNNCNCKTLTEAISFSNDNLLKLPNLEKMQKDLIDSFPYDLWS